MAQSTGDGTGLMFSAIGGEEPRLPLNEGRTESHKKEQEGFTHLFAGAMLAQRNPRSHEDAWPPDEDTAYVLECLTLASLLHRVLDRVGPDESGP